MSPVETPVHAFFVAPQTQGAAFAVAPSSWVQAGPVKVHRQAWEDE